MTTGATRLATSERVDRDWALGIARMMDDHPGRVKIYRGGVGESALADVRLDPQGATVYGQMVAGDSNQTAGRDVRNG